MHGTEFKSQGGSDFFYFIAKKDYFLIVVKVIDSIIVYINQNNDNCLFEL